MEKNEKRFGDLISEARKSKSMSQKDLALKIKKEEGDASITPQYLNDIEHNRRSPSSEHLIRQFSEVLEIDFDYLLYLAGTWVECLKNLSEQEFKEGIAAFRKKVNK